MDSIAERAAQHFLEGGGLGHRRVGTTRGGRSPARGGTDL